MRCYRMPTSIAWASKDGFREFEADNANHAMIAYRARCPFGTLTIENLQVFAGGKWEFATEAPFCAGGIMGMRT
jgi:hypothetical protein